MNISYLQLCQVILEKDNSSSQETEEDYIWDLISMLEKSCLKSIPVLGQPVIRQKRILKNGELSFIFARPDFGFGRDLEWRVEINKVSARVAIESGDYNPFLLEHLKESIQDRFLAFLSIVESAEVNQPEIKVYLNKSIFLIEDFKKRLNNPPVYKVEGDIFHFKSEVLIRLDTSRDVDIFSWLSRSIKAMAPISHFVAPPIYSGENFQIDSEAEQYSEGSLNYRVHLSRERDPRVIFKAKENFKLKHGGELYCEICKFNFFKTYGERGRDFAEGHHTLPVSKMIQGDETKVEDIRIVCSNCHRMLHYGAVITPEELRQLL
jgi:predicted HNH restriction endonuclease